jgi:hypothetical protein
MTPKLPILELQDPIAPSGSGDPRPRREPDAAGSARAQTPGSSGRRRDPPGIPAETPNWAEGSHNTTAGAAGRPPGVPWRSWSGPGSTSRTYRLPTELVIELDDRTRALRLPATATITAALLHLLDSDDDAIIELVDRVEDARLAARRAARQPRP